MTVRKPGDVRVEGSLERYTIRIGQVLEEIGLEQGSIHLRFGRFAFSRNIDPRTRQRLRNFLVNECPLP